jgi:purine-cytosine permease-like protein
MTTTSQPHTASNDVFAGIETHGVDFIPDSERTSSPWNIFSIFIGANLTFGLIVLGWLPITFGLGWWSALTSIIVGDAVGAILIVPIALLGPRTGTNGPVSSGAVFGVVGRIIGSALALFIAIGFYALAVWTGGQVAVYGAHKLFSLSTGHFALGVSYAIIAGISIVAAIWGHAKLVIIEKLLIPTVGTVMVIGFFVYAGKFNVHYSGGSYLLGGFWQTWMLAVTISAAATFGYAPYVNDWTRYISRKRHSDRSVALATGVGAFVGLTFPLAFGAYTAVAFNNPAVDYVNGLVGITPKGFLVPLVLVGLLGSLGQSTVCIYSNGLDFSSIFPVFSRVTATILLSAIGVTFIFLGTLVWNVENTVSAFVSLFGVVAAAWIGVLVTGHFWRRGRYDADALQVFNRGERGGIYWYLSGWNLRACLAWLLASGVGLLFLTTSLYTGPWSDAANGVDLSWISALVIGAGSYAIFATIFREPAAVLAGGPETLSVDVSGSSGVKVLGGSGLVSSGTSDADVE